MFSTPFFVHQEPDLKTKDKIFSDGYSDCHNNPRHLPFIKNSISPYRQLPVLLFFQKAMLSFYQYVRQEN
jgi:hypothetical protein